MSVEYSAIAAKLRAMHSKFLTRDDYEQLLTKKSVNDICAYLKSTPGYSDVLAQVNERDIHRGDMELTLEQDIVNEYVSIYKFMDFKNREVMKSWFMRREVEFLKREIRYIYTHEQHSDDEIEKGKFEAFFKSHTKINREIMHSAASLSDCIEACEGTPYAGPLKRAENLNADFFSMGMVLDSFFYREAWRSAKRNLDKTQSELFKKLFGAQIDMLNLMWIYRGKKYFGFENEIIFTYILPIHYRLSEDVIKALVMTDSTERFVDAANALTPYGELFENCNEGIFPEENYNRMYKKLSGNIFVNHSESIVAVYAYLNLKEVELNNITTIIEGIRYSLNPESIRGHIGI